MADGAPEHQVRLFVGLPVPEGVQQIVRDATAGLAGRLTDDRKRPLRWVDPTSWHITLAFIGEVPETTVPDVAEAVRRGVRRCGQMNCQLGRGGAFNDAVLWLSVRDEPPGGIARLGGLVQAGLVGAGVQVKERSVRPHITLARTRGKGRLRKGAVGEVPEVQATWTADHVVLYRSELGPAGATYHVVQHFELTG